MDTSNDSFLALLKTGKDKGAFYHEMFLRGEPSLVNGIPRTQIKGKGPYRSYKGVGNPDFHSMPSLPDVNHEAREQAKRGNEHTSTVDVAPPHGINSASSTELSRPTLSALQRSVESRFLWLQQQRRLQAQMPLLQFPTQPSLYAPPLVLPPTAHVATFIPQSILPMSYRYSAANEGSMPGRLDRQNLLMQVSHPWNQSTLEVQRLQTQCLPSRQEILQALLDAAIP
jgi:hypothetical protein